MGFRSPYQVRQYPDYRGRNHPRHYTSFYEPESRYDTRRRRYINSNYNHEIPITRQRDTNYQYKLEKRQKLIELEKINSAKIIQGWWRRHLDRMSYKNARLKQRYVLEEIEEERVVDPSQVLSYDCPYVLMEIKN